MKVVAIVPVKRFENAKSRLSGLLSLADRVVLSSLMLEDTLKELVKADRLDELVVVSSDMRAKELAHSQGATFLEEESENGVNAAVGLADSYCAGRGADASIVVPQDLALMDGKEISMACDLADGEEKCVVISPSRRYDGTNILFRKPPDAIATFFDRNSYESHLADANAKGIPVKLYFSKKLMIDIDTPEDARELVMDGAGRKDSKVIDFLRLKLV